MAVTKHPTHFFVYVGHDLQTKNKLQLEFMGYLNSLKGTLIDYKDKDDLIKNIRYKAHQLNEKHPRCKSLDIRFTNKYSNDGLMITGFEFLTFQLLEAYYDSN